MVAARAGATNPCQATAWDGGCKQRRNAPWAGGQLGAVWQCAGRVALVHLLATAAHGVPLISKGCLSEAGLPQVFCVKAAWRACSTCCLLAPCHAPLAKGTSKTKATEMLQPVGTSGASLCPQAAF